VEFTVDDGTTEQTLTSDPLTFNYSELVVKASWDSVSGRRTVTINGDEVISNEDSFTVPEALNDSVYIAHNRDGEEQVNGLLQTLKIYG
jgi:hypothetical protein